MGVGTLFFGAFLEKIFSGVPKFPKIVPISPLIFPSFLRKG